MTATSSLSGVWNRRNARKIFVRPKQKKRRQSQRVTTQLSLSVVNPVQVLGKTLRALFSQTCAPFPFTISYWVPKVPRTMSCQYVAIETPRSLLKAAYQLPGCLNVVDKCGTANTGGVRYIKSTWIEGTNTPVSYWSKVGHHILQLIYNNWNLTIKHNNFSTESSITLFYSYKCFLLTMVS